MMDLHQFEHQARARVLARLFSKPAAKGQLQAIEDVLRSFGTVQESPISTAFTQSEWDTWAAQAVEIEERHANGIVEKYHGQATTASASSETTAFFIDNINTPTELAEIVEVGWSSPPQRNPTFRPLKCSAVRDSTVSYLVGLQDRHLNNPWPRPGQIYDITHGGLPARSEDVRGGGYFVKVADKTHFWKTLLALLSANDVSSLQMVSPVMNRKVQLELSRM
ncbi:unnamed protein product [Zymoseptoria tritici ST99CH_3D1]|uniref:Uncharacterized protein n=1 Tax=Zymoseptoria tritici (strain ST99CH_3D7) TaxID=1276538 RepID=A0A1X7RVS1_ZYMT9|nr:unnamed protein product [Zymoseptoria tritici ST99CH_3D7]SMR54917.1 unnamed protein product [Zymoseptoria tritici ST99CH_3D1]